MRERILELINSYWKFDEYQQPMSSWHDKQDLLKIVEEEFDKESNIIDNGESIKIN
jgi:hypothetical protein